VRARDVYYLYAIIPYSWKELWNTVSDILLLMMNVTASSSGAEETAGIMA
jgi:hypothetical protein